MRFGGTSPGPQAERAAELCPLQGLEASVVDDDEELWRSHREAQRPRAGKPDTVVRVAAVQTDLPALLAFAGEHAEVLVGRAPLGLHWLRLPDHLPLPPRS